MIKIFNSPFQVTQGYGLRPEYYSQFGLKGHEGLDLVPTTSDWSVYSMPYKGTVVLDIDMGEKGGAYGNHCTIWYPDIKKAFMYCHLSQNYVSQGQELKPVSLIGKMGATGNTEGAHLHLNMFEVDENGVHLNKDNGYLGGLDPLPFLEQDIDEGSIIPGNMPEYLTGLFQENSLDINDEDQIRKAFQKIRDFDGVKTDKENAEAVNRQQAEMLNHLQVELTACQNKPQNPIENGTKVPTSPLGKVFYQLATMFG